MIVVRYFKNGKLMSTKTSDAPVTFRPQPTKEELGRAAWGWLHPRALAGTLTQEQIDTEWLPMIPDYGCVCRAKARAILKKIPFRAEDQFAWTVDVHNAVNADPEVNKPQVTEETARAIWTAAAADLTSGAVSGAHHDPAAR